MKTKKIALLGNPNVGKSTIFNALTGLKQHTGNWAGKTVGQAIGYTTYQDYELEIIDLPGATSLNYNNAEEKYAVEYIKKQEYDVVIVVCDAVCLERSLNLVLQTLELTNKVIVCLNLIDEASKKGIIINSQKLSRLLNVPVIPTSAKNKIGLNKLLKTCINYSPKESYQLTYPSHIESKLTDLTKEKRYEKLQNLLQEDEIIEKEIIQTTMQTAKKIEQQIVTYTKNNYEQKDRQIDKILTNKKTGLPIMILILFFILWLTISFSNLPSDKLFDLFNILGDKIAIFLNNLPIPQFINDMIILGVYKTLTWVISVMLPPMAIFFPLFTILEDYGLLPRIAFNTDKAFQKCQACGKQCLTMLMGFGCNAVGVTGARIIESKRERLMAILTNVFVPCNGRFPTIIAIITMFFLKSSNHIFNSFMSAFLLTVVIIFSFVITFLVSFFLSKTFLKGYPTNFILELPPYRKPKIISVIIRSIFERTLHILGRAIIVAIPAGVCLFLLANIHIHNQSILIILANIFNKFGHLIGLDGVIIIAFLLSFPANEITIPIMLMGYLATGSLVEYESLNSLKNILVTNGWNTLTAINFLILTLLHYPCSTTILTIQKEIKSFKWTILAIVLPTAIGISLCLLTKIIWSIIF